MKRNFFMMILIAATLVLVSAKPAWQQEWEDVVKAARQEGQVSVIGPAGSERRDALTRLFEKKYGVRVEYRGMRSSSIPPLVGAEQRAGYYLWDLFIGGSGSAQRALIPIGAFAPLEPALVRPEVKDPKHWRGGGMEFLGPGRQLLVMCLSQQPMLFISTNLVKLDEIKSYKDLLEPKWKGKLVLDDPRTPGAGQATLHFFYLHPDLGPDFIRALARQNLVVLKNYRQEIDMIGQGKFPILIGGSDAVADSVIKQGVPIAILDPRHLREGSAVNPAAGTTAMFNRAPHPNAAKVYFNWLLSKEGQTSYTQVTGYISARSDVRIDHAPLRVPIPGSIKTYTPEAMKARIKLGGLLREVFKR